jgi:(+)-pinoresinol hydroxylase
MMMRKIAVVVALSIAFGTEVHAEDAALIKQGDAAFQYHCAPCHGSGIGLMGSPMLPGTQALAAKYHGTEPALLEQRTDLSPDVVKFFVRNGVSIMPFFRKTMVSDSDLNAIAAYLSRNYKPDK